MGAVDEYLGFETNIEKTKRRIAEDRAAWQQKIDEQEQTDREAQKKLDESLKLLQESMMLKFMP